MQSEAGQTESTYTFSELTFHYADGRNESFTVYEALDGATTQQGIQVKVRHILKKEWWILQLPEQSVFINIDNVIKVEAKPPLVQIQGEDVFSEADRITALSRGH
ncbi:MAG: hypothetical protein WBA57_03320 [Elainellaceae cyanobacterium]